VAEYLGMAPMAAFEVASFYNMYDLHPVGKYKITVCTNLPCALSGGVHAADYVKKSSASTSTKPPPTASSP
jgi:NADH-quinone oxidoreductase subunit E